jgi:quercetin dioxygenase-like cupin family protein
MDVGVPPGTICWLLMDYAAGERQGMHHTDTVDLDLVLEGSIELILDDGAHPLVAGDGVVVNGIDHGWHAGPEGARMSVTFLGSPPRL